MKQIILLGAVPKDNNNRGCQALTLGAINLICQNHSDIETILIVNPGNKTTQEDSVNINGKYIKIIYEFCSKNDYYNFVTDSICYKIFKRTKNKFINLFLNSDIIYTINAGDGFTDIYGTKRLLMVFIESFLAFVCNKKLTLLPQTIGPFNTFLGKMLSKFVLKNANKIFIRDKQANKYLDSINVKYQNSLDVSIYMKPEPIEIKVPAGTIGLNISGLLLYKTDLKDASSFDNYKNLVIALIKKLIALDKNILLIPHTYNAKKPDYADDLSACREIKDAINHPNISIVEQNYTAPQLKYIISKCEFFIGSRMHSNFAALSTSTPVVGLGYSYKFKGGFEMFGVPECAISVKNISINDIQKIVQKIINLMNEKDSIRQRLMKVNEDKSILVL